MEEKKKKIRELDKFELFKSKYIYYTDKEKTIARSVSPLDFINDEKELDRILELFEKL
jgi:hypothetical protein